MDDLISKFGLIHAFEKYTGLKWDHLTTLFPVLEVVHRLPTEPKQETGEWIYVDDDRDIYDTYYCTSCHRYITVDAERKCDIGFIIEDMQYCPLCGSYNGGEQDGKR